MITSDDASSPFWTGYGPQQSPMTTATAERASTIEATPAEWRKALFPDTYTAPLAEYHNEFWRWVWDVKPGVMPPPYLAIWPRGWAKSTNGEVAVIALAAVKKRRYCLYVCGTQQQADDHVQNIAIRLEGSTVEHYYSDLATPNIGKYGNQRGWRRNRISTKAGFTVDAVGLDVLGMRGVKLDNDRPDIIAFDDIDGITDSPETITKKGTIITKTILPAGSPDVAVMGLQNLITRNGIMSQLVDGRADFLKGRIISGPHKAIDGMEVDADGTIIAGVATWDVLGWDVCQDKIGLMGLRAFLTECQHEVELSGQPRFNLDLLNYQLQNAPKPLPSKLLPAHLQGIEGLRVYSLPRPGVAYVQYSDMAEGKGRDYHATGGAEAGTRQVAYVLEDNFREPQKHADIAADLYFWFNEPLTGYERAKAEALAGVYGALGVTRLYQHEDNPLTPQQRAAGIERKLRPGYPMTEHTRRGLIDRLGTLIEQNAVGIVDERTIQECKDFIVTERNRVEAAPGGHDDLVMMLGGLMMLCEQPGATSLRATERRPQHQTRYYEANPALRGQ